MIEYRVTMQDGSIFSWSHLDEVSALEEMRSKSYKPIHIEPWHEYELEQQTKQLEWNWKLERDIEGEKTA